MDIDELKKSWQSLDSKLDGMKTQIDELRHGKTLGHRDSIMRKYKVLFMVCLMMIFVSINLCSKPEVGNVMGILLAIYFAIHAVLGFIIHSRFSKIDYSRMNIKELLIEVTNAHILRSRFKIAGYCMMVPVLVALLGKLYVENVHMFYGGVIGGIIGLIVGLAIDRKIERQIREMKENLRLELQEDDSDIVE